MFGKKPGSQQTTPKTITVHTSIISAADRAELHDILSAAGHHLARIDGAAHALALSMNAAPEALVPLLELENLPERARHLVTTYSQGVWQKLDVEEPDFTLDVALFADRANVEAWMLGLVHGIKVVPEKLQTLISPLAQGLLDEDTLTLLFMVITFAEADLIKDGFLASDSEPAETSREAREDFLDMLDKLTPEDRAGTLAQVVERLFEAYALVNVLPDGLTAFSSHRQTTVQQTTVQQTTVRREGRKIRANAPCPCGSGRKYKKCHGAPGADPLPDTAPE